MIIGVDVDDVCADLSSEWLRLYNYDYDDNLTKEKITDWDIVRFVRPECGNRIMDYLEYPELYDNVLPVKDALEGVQLLRTFGRVIFITMCPMKVAGRKYFWLRDHGFIESDKDYVEAHDKTLIKADYLIDDSYANVSWNKKSFLFEAPWNARFPHPLRIKNWREFIDRRKCK